MRKVSMALLVGALLATAGCNLTIPSNLINIQTDGQGSTDPAAIEGDAEDRGDVDDKRLLPGVSEPGHPGMERPPVMPPHEGDCHGSFKQFDGNGDGFWDGAEFKQWAATQPVPMIACAEPPRISPNDLDRPMEDPAVMQPAIAPACEVPGPRFEHHDHDGDGRISADEFCGRIAVPPQPPVMPPPADDCVVQFKHKDMSGEGKLTWDEFFTAATITANFPNEADYARYKEEMNRKFMALDRDGNGVVTVEEHCGQNVPPVADGCEGSFKAFDKDESGALSYDEYAAGRYGELRFVQAPSQEEAARMVGDFKAKAKALDANGDQKLAFEEFKPSCQ